jgi:DNA-binding transcriptional LysR family regulator
MEIKEVEAFLALADELHFARAAQRLGMSPGRLSQLIQALERRIGGKLAWRTSRSVRLTDLGERFHKDVKAGYDLLQDAIASAQAEAGRDEATLRLGISKLAGVPYAIELCEAFEHRNPQWRVQLVTVSSQEMWAPLLRAEVDVMLGRLPCPPQAVPDRQGILIGPVVAREGRVVLAAQDHPVAGRAAIDVEELAGHAVVRWSGMLPGWFKAAWLPPVTPQGRPIPRGGDAVGEPEEFCYQIVRRGLLHIAPAADPQAVPWPRVVAVPLTGLPPFHLVLARVRGQDSAPTRALVNLVTGAAAHSSW